MVVPSALASADVVSLVKDVQLATMALVYAPDGNLVAQAQDELKAKEAALREALARQARGANGQAQKGLLTQDQTKTQGVIRKHRESMTQHRLKAYDSRVKRGIYMGTARSS